MTNTEFLIGNCGLDFKNSFYPDDLPKEWRFDYYISFFQAIFLDIQYNGFDKVFNELEDFEGDFEVVIGIKKSQINNIKKLIKPVEKYKSKFVLFCQIDNILNNEMMNFLNNYNVCLYSKKELQTNLKYKKVSGQNIYFNNTPIVFLSKQLDEKKIREFLENTAKINTKTIFICKNNTSENLDKIKIISEILGF